MKEGLELVRPTPNHDPNPPAVQEEPLYVAIVNYNGLQDTLHCLRSVAGSTYRPFHTLVVDNASRDNSAKEIQRLFPEVEVVELSRNRGYTGGCNVAIEAALSRGAACCLVLNNDTEIHQDALGYLASTALNHDDVAAVGPRVMDLTNRKIMRSLGGEIDMKTGRTTHEGSGKLEDLDSNSVRGIRGFLDGSAIMFVLKHIRSIGLFDERYFMYHDESDWCYRARALGYRLLLDGRATVWHKARGTAKLTDHRVHYLSQRSRILFLARFSSRRNWLEFWLRLPLEAVQALGTQSEENRQPGTQSRHGQAIIHGLIDGLCKGDRFRERYRFE